jgi:YVTN family beta-propeller protein
MAGAHVPRHPLTVRASLFGALVIGTTLTAVPLAAPAYASGPAITAVTFGGTPSYPTVTVWGSGFGTESALGAPSPAACGYSGSDYNTNIDFSDNGWTAGDGSGGGGDCIGLVVSSYSDGEISFALGSGYTLAGIYDPVTAGDSFSTTVLGTSFNGTVAYPAKPSGTGPYAYVANSGNGTVSVADTGTHQVVGLVAVGSDPNDVVATPSGADVFVANNGSGTVSEIATSTNIVVRTITLAGIRDIAMSPDGATLYATGGGSDNQLYPVDVASGTVGTPITVGSGATALALTPDGSKAYVATGSSLVPVDLVLGTTGSPIASGFTLGPFQVEMSPSGTTVYFSGFSSPPYETILPITVATNATQPSILACHDDAGSQFALSPGGTSAWVACNGDGTVEQFDLSTGLEVGSYDLGQGSADPLAGVAVSPDGGTVYVVDQAAEVFLAPFDVTSLVADFGISTGSGAQPTGVAITPDQGPSAALSATTSGGTTTLDASASVAGTSPIVSYSWSFGDGSPVSVTSTATTTHVYATAGTYSATVTETDAAGTSTSQVFTGQTASLNGSSAARASASVVVVNQGCDPNATCTAALEAPSTPTTPAQSVTVTASTPSGESEVLTVTNGPGTLKCSSTGFHQVGNVTSYAATFTPTGNVHVTDLIEGATSTSGVKVCFKGTSPPANYLPTCALSPAPCVSNLKVVAGGVKVSLKVPAADPRYRIEGVDSAIESPTGIPATAVVGSKIKITGTELLGPDGRTLPLVGFTSVGGSTVSAQVVSATATAIKVKVPDGAAKGPVTLVWPQETAVSPKVKIT